MTDDCTCGECRLALRKDIAQVFLRNRRWMGIFQVRYHAHMGWYSWEFFQDVWAEMIEHGLIISSFAPESDDFPRYLLSRLAVKP